MNVYLDTSGLNYLADNYNSDIMHELDSRGIEFFFSPITLWEILLNSNFSRKEILIYWGQMFANEYLIKSPSEIIIDYINSNCPLSDRVKFAKDPFTKLDIGKIWKNIHGRLDKTIPIDVNKLKDYTKVTHMLSKKMSKIVTSMTSNNYENKKNDPLYIAARNINEKLSFPWIDEYKDFTIISVILVFFIICIGIELDKVIIRKFWNDKDINEPIDRLEFLIDNHIQLFKRGPVTEMSYMVKTQLSMNKSKSRGMIHDCFHVLYAYYADLFVTGDSHFKEFMKNIDHIAFKNIVFIDDLHTQLEKIIQDVLNKK